MNLYTRLGLERWASEEDIKAAYRKLAMKYHPDRTMGDKVLEEEFKQVKEAYETLSNPERRKLYDDTGMSAEVTPDDVEAIGLVMTMLDICLREDRAPLHLILYAKANISGIIQQTGINHSNLLIERRRLQKFRGCVKTTDGKRNLVEMLLDQKMRDLQAAIEKQERQSRVAHLALKMVDDHSVDELVQLIHVPPFAVV